ncbi:hypothetical protein ACFS5L_02425 [Streptomyces phyllanthi]|uniref:Uncharacterized protein n=1 Tax=Streptomyces phyllanthi TaxID=1803180 RepID=A0A5N8VWS7_9ACTN|nr:hypothetical protein [Streptomyces phyllanthi]MPY38508.1 hypothetical protein [Streptomyces phyllanthi]
MHLEDIISSPYARVERDRNSGTYSIVVMSEQPGNGDTIQVFRVPLPSGRGPGEASEPVEDSELDALVCNAAEDVLLDASYELTSAWRVVGDGCYAVGVTIPDSVFEQQNERIRAAAAAVEGLEPVDWSEAEALFETAEITPEGDLGSTYELDEWLEKDVNVAFYRTADGRLLARPVDRFERPSTKLFSARFRSASLVSVFPNPHPVQTVLDRSQEDHEDQGDIDESDHCFEHEDGMEAGTGMLSRRCGWTRTCPGHPCSTSTPAGHGSSFWQPCTTGIPRNCAGTTGCSYEGTPSPSTRVPDRTPAN